MPTTSKASPGSPLARRRRWPWGRPSPTLRTSGALRARRRRDRRIRRRAGAAVSARRARSRSSPRPTRSRRGPRLHGACRLHGGDAPVGGAHQRSDPGIRSCSSLDLVRELVEGLPPIENGVVRPPDAPGHGVRMRPEVLTRRDACVRTSHSDACGRVAVAPRPRDARRLQVDARCASLSTAVRFGEIRDLRVVESEQRASQVIVQRRDPALGNPRSAVTRTERGSRRRAVAVRVPAALDGESDTFVKSSSPHSSAAATTAALLTV